MWKKLALDGREYVFQHRFDADTGKYQILLSDLKVLYTQRFDLEEFSAQFQQINRDLEVSNYDEILQDMFTVLDSWPQGQKKAAAILKAHFKGKPLY
jgi:hypothetical protein